MASCGVAVGEEGKEGKSGAERKEGGKECCREGGRQRKKEGRNKKKEGRSEEGRKLRKEKGRDFCTQESMKFSCFFLSFLLKSEHKHKELTQMLLPKL